MSKYQVLNQGKLWDKFKLHIYQNCNHQSKISFSQQGTFQYLHFTEYETKQVHISCFASRDIEGHCQPSYLSNFKPYRLQSHFHDKGFHFTLFKTKQVHISFFKSRDKFNLLIYQTCNHSLFCDKGHSNTFILPNTKTNRFTYQVLNQGKLRDKFNLHIYQNCNHIV